MEQPISNLPTSSKFHLTASEPQLIPPRLDFLSASCGRSSGSSSSNEFGRSWEERILDLSAELQQICGSPLSPPCSAVTGARSPDLLQWLTTTVAASPPPRRLTATSPRSVPSTAVSLAASDRRSGLYSTTTTPLRLTCSLGRSADGSSTADLVRRTISLNAGGHSPEPVGGRPRPIMVRHEETHATLAKRLSAICGKSSQAVDVDAKDRQTTLIPEAPRSSMRANVAASETGSSRVRIKVDLDACRAAEDLVVSVSDDRQLTVDAYDGATTRRLHRAELPSGVADSLLCHMNSSGTVYILERPRGTGLSVEFVGTKSIFLPVIHCDEVQLMMTLVLRVPDDFRFEDLAVKTVDNNVWITGGGKLGASLLSVSSGGDMFSFPVRRGPGSRLTDGSKGRRFKVVVPLPKGCDNRSVVAALSANNQLVLKAKLSAACRRYTF